MVKWIDMSDYIVDKITKEMEQLEEIPLVWTKEENPEPQQSEEKLSKEQIEKEIEKYWKAIDKEIGYEAYFNNWERLNYYRDLKLKLYK